MYKLIIIRDGIVYLVCQSPHGAIYLTKVYIKEHKLVKKSAKGRHMTAIRPIEQHKVFLQNYFKVEPVKGKDYLLVKKCQPYPKMPVKSQGL